MTDEAARRLVQPGDPAPNFTLPAVNREGSVALQDYRGKGPVLVGLFRGLHCPFYRRHLTTMNIGDEELRAMGVETLAIVATEPERAKLYFRHRPARVLLAADPAQVTHAAFGLPTMEFTESPTDWANKKVSMADMMTMRFNPTGELPEPLPGLEAGEALTALDGFEMTPVDQQIMGGFSTVLIGQFLVDREGIVRETFLEAKDDPADFGKFPNVDEFVAAAARLRA